MQPLSLRSFARAIVHVDADAFFASCEQAANPKLRGKPVVTGKERGIASAVSYEAKARGVRRGMTIRDVKAICPEAIHLPSDYETYSSFSQRMLYEAIAERIKADLEGELGLTFSIGLAPTKVVANIASKWNKPAGLTVI